MWSSPSKTWRYISWSSTVTGSETSSFGSVLAGSGDGGASRFSGTGSGSGSGARFGSGLAGSGGLRRLGGVLAAEVARQRLLARRLAALAPRRADREGGVVVRLRARLADLGPGQHHAPVAAVQGLRQVAQRLV